MTAAGGLKSGEISTWSRDQVETLPRSAPNPTIETKTDRTRRRC